jgi:hypothetical protein
MTPVRDCDYTGIFARLAWVFQSLLKELRSTLDTSHRKIAPKTDAYSDAPCFMHDSGLEQRLQAPLKADSLILLPTRNNRSLVGVRCYEWMQEAHLQTFISNKQDRKGAGQPDLMQSLKP